MPPALPLAPPAPATIAGAPPSPPFSEPAVLVVLPPLPAAGPPPLEAGAPLLANGPEPPPLVAPPAETAPALAFAAPLCGDIMPLAPALDSTGEPSVELAQAQTQTTGSTATTCEHRTFTSVKGGSLQQLCAKRPMRGEWVCHTPFELQLCRPPTVSIGLKAFRAEPLDRADTPLTASSCFQALR